MAKNIGDLWPTCPAEWSKKKAPATIRRMVDRYGIVGAKKRAKRYLLQYEDDTWGWKFWRFVLSLMSEL